MATADLLKRLVSSVSIPGVGKTTLDIIKAELKPHADEIKIDKIGNLIARKGKGGPKVMIAAHTDEIELAVKYIDKDGFIKFETVGGWDDRILPASKMVIHGSRGPVTGVIGIKPMHLLEKEEMKRTIRYKDLFMDIGAKSKKEVERAGVSVGDYITFDAPLEKLVSGRFTARGLDNRLGCFVMIEAFKRLKGFKGTLYAVGSSMEEIGLIGVRGATYGINPDVVLAVDTTIAGDTPDFRPGDTPVDLGKGPTLVLKDGGQLINSRVKKWIRDAAKKARIPLQEEVTSGGTTDAAIVPTVREGIPSGCLAIPTRYIHTGVSVGDTKDTENTIKLIVEAVRSAGKHF